MSTRKERVAKIALQEARRDAKKASDAVMKASLRKRAALQELFEAMIEERDAVIAQKYTRNL